MPNQSQSNRLSHCEFRLHCLGYAKLTSAIRSNFKAARLVHLSSTELEQAIQMLDARFTAWRGSLPKFARPNSGDDLRELPAKWNSQLAEYLRCACHALIFGIHSLLAHPWVVESLCSCIRRDLSERIEKSSALVAETSREVIMASNSMDITASNPNW